MCYSAIISIIVNKVPPVPINKFPIGSLVLNANTAATKPPAYRIQKKKLIDDDESPISAMGKTTVVRSHSLSLASMPSVVLDRCAQLVW